MVAKDEACAGPSLAIGCVSCGLHGIKGGMSHSQEEMKAARQTGTRPLHPGRNRLQMHFIPFQKFVTFTRHCLNDPKFGRVSDQSEQHLRDASHLLWRVLLNENPREISSE